MFAGTTVKVPLTADCWLCGQPVRMPLYGTTLECPACQVRWVWSAQTPEEWQLARERLEADDRKGYLRWYGCTPDEPEDMFDNFIDHSAVYVPVPS